MGEELGREFIRVLLRRNRIIRLATIGRSGEPTVAPVWYGFGEDDRIVVTMPESATVRNILRTGTATVLVDEGQAFADLRGAIIIATARAYRDDEAPAELRTRVAAADEKYADEIAELVAVRSRYESSSRAAKATYRLDLRPQRARWFTLGGSISGTVVFSTPASTADDDGY